MSAKIISSKRDNPQIIINNFKFHKAYEGVNKVRWRCINKSCKAKVFTKTNVYTEILNTENEHNHEAVNENTINWQIVNTSCKRKALEDVSTRPKKIILQELIHNECVKEITINDINRIRKNMYENRRKTLPANPKSIAEVHQALNVMNIETKQKENFLLLNDENENIIIFSCYTNLKCLSLVDTLYMDGTFDYCIRFFMQMFTIHGFQNGHYIPLVFCLLPNKLTYSYAFAL
ncbi:Uncharacterized protein FWK35_00035060 [Aphis craccivora]|uniref:FLYWCH-type domain-containing protein n=1 Tax=Aphis craccivora TaxID=307492 RepID=A0A6G0VIJ7_APHCR|nr:Uncharacterized protein FWK35_00035060 [Aphis craccivora]